MTDFTFAIVNWNTRELLDKCLASIEAERGDFEVQVMVADNASDDGSADMVASRYPDVELLCNDRNRGFAPAHAALFKRSRGRYHVLVNSDVRLLPGCLAVLDRRMREDERIGVLGCRVIGPDGGIQPSCRRFPSLSRQALEASGLGRVFPRSRFWNGYRMGDFDHRDSREVDQVIGAMFLIRDSAVREVGTLDTEFFMYYEEVDYCLRCREAGYKVFYEAEAAVYHEGGASSRRVRVATIRRTMRSMRRYFRKHRGAWTWLPLMAIVSLDGVTHLFFALLTRGQPLTTLRAYALAWWDVLRCKASDG